MFISPSELTATQIKSLISIKDHNKPAPISSGFAFTRSGYISWKLIRELCELNLIISDGENVVLTKAGSRIASNFSNKSVLGYD